MPPRIDYEYLAIQVQERVQAEVPDLLTHLSMLSVSDNIVNFPNSQSRHDDGNLAMLLASRSHRDLNILTKSSEKVHKAFDGKSPGLAPHEA